MMKSSEVFFALKKRVIQESGATEEVDVQPCQQVAYR